MKTILCLLTIWFGSLSAMANTPLTYFDSEAGQKRLEESKHKADFYQLSMNFQWQKNKAFCGVASMAVVMNTLGRRMNEKTAMMEESMSLPESKTSQNSDVKYLTLAGKPKRNIHFKLFDQRNVFDKSPKKLQHTLGKPIKVKCKKEKIKDFGFQLYQLGEAISANGFKSKSVSVNKKLQLNEMRSQFKRNLKNKNDFLLVNYKRSEVGQKGGGHISPIGAYHEKSDSFLIMDVSPSRKWLWVKAQDLYNSMNTFDTCENRGFVEISLKR